MHTKMIFPNLAVKDLKKTIDFFSKLDFTFNEKFTDENAACLVINECAGVMLLTEPFFGSFTQKELTDSNKSIEVMLAISYESPAEVDRLADKALQLGAKESRREDLGFMYSRSFFDLDGHTWELFWMDEEAQ